MSSLHFSASLSPHACARSSKSSKKSKRSDVSLLKYGALLDVGVGIVLIPLEMADMAGVDGMAGVGSAGGGIDGGLGKVTGLNVSAWLVSSRPGMEVMGLICGARLDMVQMGIKGDSR